LAESRAGGSEQPLDLDLDADGELLREFVNESYEHLQNIELGVLALEENPKDADTLNSIFRAFHTFKGGSGFLNLTPIRDLAHELESLLDLARNHKLIITSDVIDVILESGDTLKRFVAAIAAQISGKTPPQEIMIPIEALLARVRLFLDQPVSPVAFTSGSTVPRNVSPPVSLLLNPKAASAVVPAQQMVPPLATSAGVSSPPAAPLASAPAVEPAATDPRNGGAGLVKVDTEKLDSLIDLVGEMVIAQSLIAQDPDICALRGQQATRNLAQLGRITNDIQRTAMSLRMVPIRATFRKLTRVVRDLSAKQRKEIELSMSGEETELDRNIVEAINDPLVHMIRNAVDHGIEPTEVRRGRGKSPVGRIHLSAFHQAGKIVIRVKDDGGGLNKDRILRKAIEKNLVEEGEPLSEKDIFKFIFAPGFSTAENITDISGRGVGMDVVRRNIQNLRGKIEVESAEGIGSSFTISLPLTLAIIDGLVVQVGGERFILPTLSVRESFRPSREMLSTLHERGELVNVRGKISPLLRLHQCFDLKPRSMDPCDGILVVVTSGEADRCVLVDGLVGKQEIVIKSLGETFNRSRALAGAAILGDGSVGLILDSDALVNLKMNSSTAAFEPSPISRP
jgi:two-component system chemotaxis sensor kinase CheA